VLDNTVAMQALHVAKMKSAPLDAFCP